MIPKVGSFIIFTHWSQIPWIILCLITTCTTQIKYVWPKCGSHLQFSNGHMPWRIVLTIESVFNNKSTLYGLHVKCVVTAGSCLAHTAFASPVAQMFLLSGLIIKYMFTLSVHENPCTDIYYYCFSVIVIQSAWYIMSNGTPGYKVVLRSFI